MESVEQKIQKLPVHLQKEVNDFVDFLLEKNIHHQGRKLSLNWFGGLKEYREKFTALELQKNKKLILVSYDKHFDSTDIGRSEPSSITS